MAAIAGLTWRRGWLRPYESKASLLRKLIHANVVRRYRIKQLLNHFYEGGRLRKTKALSRELDEPLETIVSMDAARYWPSSALFQAIGVSQKQLGCVRRICDQCMQFGFHSHLHDHPWLDRCLFDGQQTRFWPLDARKDNHIYGMRLVEWHERRADATPLLEQYCAMIDAANRGKAPLGRVVLMADLSRYRRTHEAAIQTFMGCAAALLGMASLQSVFPAPSGEPPLQLSWQISGAEDLEWLSSEDTMCEGLLARRRAVRAGRLATPWTRFVQAEVDWMIRLRNDRTRPEDRFWQLSSFVQSAESWFPTARSTLTPLVRPEMCTATVAAVMDSVLLELAHAHIASNYACTSGMQDTYPDAVGYSFSPLLLFTRLRKSLKLFVWHRVRWPDELSRAKVSLNEE